MISKLSSFGIYSSKDNDKVKYTFGNKVRVLESAPEDIVAMPEKPKSSNKPKLQDRNWLALDASINPKYADGIIENIIGGRTTLSPKSKENATSDLYKLYRDIYLHDIGGLVIDLIIKIILANKYELIMDDITDVDEKAVIEKVKSCYPEDLKKLITDITQDYLVYGKHISYLGFSDGKVVARRLEPQCVSLYDTQLLGENPIMKVDTTDMDNVYSDDYSDILKKFYKKTNVEIPAGGVLDADRILFAIRGSFLPHFGNSYLNRIIPTFILEKTLFKGTVEKARRRQNPITHITIDQGMTQVTQSQLAAVAKMATEADQDPVNGIMVTSNAVKFNDVKSINNLWKWTDTVNTFYDLKLKYLGINPSLLSSNATISTTETSLDFLSSQVSSIIEDINGSITSLNSFILDKVYKGWNSKTKNAQISLSHTHNDKDDSKDKIDALMHLADMGFPISLTQLIAAASTDIEEVTNLLESDKSIIANIAEKRKEIISDLKEKGLLKYLSPDLLNTLGIVDTDDIPTNALPDSNSGSKKKLSKAVIDNLENSINLLQKYTEKEALQHTYKEAGKDPRNDVRKVNAAGEIQTISPNEKRRLREKHITNLVKAKEK